MAKRKPISAAEHKQRVNNFIQKQMDSFLEIIESNKTEKWSKPWKDLFGGLGGLPHNPATKHRYQGSNTLFLMIDMMLNKWNDPRFLTLSQARRYADEQGMDPREVKIKKGSKASWILQPIVIGGKKDDKKDQGSADQIDSKSRTEKIINNILDGKTGDKRNNDKQDDDERVFIRFKTVARFNAEQFVGFPQLEDLAGDAENRSANAIVQHFIDANKIDLRHGTEAKYSFNRSDPNDEFIEMPYISTFESDDQYSSTLLHETFHWTGGKKREDRLVPGDRTEYAKEEIRAQMFMVSASALLDIPIRLEQEGSYVENFRTRGELDYKALYKEFKAASKMFTEVLVPFVADEQPTPSWFPDKSTWPERSAEATETAEKASGKLLDKAVTPQVETPKEQDSPDPLPSPAELTPDKPKPESAKPANVGIFDLITNNSKPSQLDIFDLSESKTEKTVEDDFGMRM